MKQFTRLVIASIAFFSMPSHAFESAFLIEEGLGTLRGYTQTPRGGTANTTSEQRPSFSEVGITQDPFFHAAATLRHAYFLVFVDYFQLHPHGDTILANDLLTHSYFIPAGSPFDLSVHYNWSQLGIGLGSGEYFENTRFELTISANWIKYIYTFSSPLAQSVRDFNLMAATCGFKVEYNMNNRWLLDATAEISLPLSELTLIDGSIGLNYLFRLNQHFSLAPRLSIGGLYINYEDKQPIPNHLRYQSTPYGALGLVFLLS